MKNRAIVEFNRNGYLVYSESFPGAYVRGVSLDEALSKFPAEIKSYCRWASVSTYEQGLENIIIQEKPSKLKICDADSDVIFNSEKEPLTFDQYESLKALAIKSAEDFQKLYDSIPNKDKTSLSARNSFYGSIPRTAREMYEHTNDVTSYYVGEIGLEIENLNHIAENRVQIFQVIETSFEYLARQVFNGSYGEEWSLKKVLRRFIWHDRIHAKAMYRMAIKLWDTDMVADPFCFRE